MYVEVNFKRANGDYGGPVYTYNCTIPHIKTGDLVIAPTFKGDTPAKIVGIGISYDEINPRFRDNLRTITERQEYDPDEGPEILSFFEVGADD